MNIPGDAGRSVPPSPPDIEPPDASATAMTVPWYRDEDGFSVAPKPDQSALPFLVRGPAAPSQDTRVNTSEVDHAVRMCRADIPMNGSQLADALRNPNLNEAERNLVIQKLARDGGELAFYANDASRLHDSDQGALSADQRIIAEGVQNAYSKGAIDEKDLQRIADKNAAPNGAQRFMSILRLGGDSRDAGSAAEGLADTLWARNGADGKDRAVAAMYYSSDPAQMSSNLDTPDKRAEAFEALVNFNEADLYKDLPPGATVTTWRNDATTSAGRLFIAHGQELMDRYTDITPEHGAETEVLAKFVSQTLLNPEAEGLVLDRHRDLLPTLRSVLGSATDTYLNRAKEAPPESADQVRAMDQLGRLSASVAAAGSLALTDYSTKVAEREEAVNAIADLVGSTVGAMTGKLDTPFGNPAEEGAKAITKEILETIKANPQRPDSAYSRALYDHLSSRIAGLETELQQPRLSIPFHAARGAEGHELNENLNINPGGHAK
jgi:hypothetical protein